MLGELDWYMLKNEARPPTHTIYQNKLRWIKDLNIGHDTIKVLEKKAVKSPREKSPSEKSRYPM